jgi:hypothetical protein
MDASGTILSVNTQGFTLTVKQIAARGISATLEEVVDELTPPKGTKDPSEWLLKRGVVRTPWRSRGSRSKYVYEINPSRNTLIHDLPRASRRSSCECPVCSRVQSLLSLARPCRLWLIYDF